MFEPGSTIQPEGGDTMESLNRKSESVCSTCWSPARCSAPLFVLILMLAGALPLRAQSPWESAVTVLQGAFTTTIARGLSLVAIVVGGITFAFSEGDSKRMLAGILFGVGMAIGAVNFMNWLFP